VRLDGRIEYPSNNLQGQFQGSGGVRMSPCSIGGQELPLLFAHTYRGFDQMNSDMCAQPILTACVIIRYEDFKSSKLTRIMNLMGP